MKGEIEETVDSQSWHAFFSDYKNIRQDDDDIENWNDFFKKLAFMQHPRIIKFSALHQFLSAFSRIHKQWRETGACLDLCELFFADRDERYNCKLLAWLLNKNSSHRQDDVFIRLFLKLAKDNGGLDEEAARYFPIFTGNIGHYEVSLEKAYDNDIIDIKVQGEKFLLFIEAKVDSIEGLNQLDRYFNQLERSHHTEKWGMVFLTLTGTLPRSKSLQGKIACVSWAQVGKAFLTRIKTLEKKRDISSALVLTLSQLAKHFSNL